MGSTVGINPCYTSFISRLIRDDGQPGNINVQMVDDTLGQIPECKIKVNPQQTLPNSTVT